MTSPQRFADLHLPPADSDLREELERFCRSHGEGVNEPFLREVLTWISLHQDLWDQRGWVTHTACGTTYCIAGWAYVLGTQEWFGRDNHRRIRSTLPVYPVARRLLGLTPEQASDLFMFTTVVVPGKANNGLGTARPPTFAELCAKVEEVTGVRFKETDEEGAG